MDGWLDRELTFEDLELPLQFEAECASDLATAAEDCLPYMEELDPDAEYIKAVAAGEYMHGMPKGPAGQRPEPVELVAVEAPDEKALLAGFANVMGWGGDDFTETGYLKAVAQNKAGKAAVIKDLAGIRSSEDEDS